MPLDGGGHLGRYGAGDEAVAGRLRLGQRGEAERHPHDGDGPTRVSAVVWGKCLADPLAGGGREVPDAAMATASSRRPATAAGYPAYGEGEAVAGEQTAAAMC